MSLAKCLQSTSPLMAPSYPTFPHGQDNLPPPQASTPPSPPSSGSSTPSPSPSPTVPPAFGWSGTKPCGDHRSRTHFKADSMSPLPEVANGDVGTIRVHVSSHGVLAQTEIKFGSYSVDPSKCIKEFQGLIMAFDLTWQDIHIILTTCCTLEESYTGLRSKIRRETGSWTCLGSP